MDFIADQSLYSIRQALEKGRRIKDGVATVDSIDDGVPPFVFELEEEVHIV
jgi:hypothetical protein